MRQRRKFYEEQEMPCYQKEADKSLGNTMRKKSIMNLTHSRIRKQKRNGGKQN